MREEQRLDTGCGVNRICVPRSDNAPACRRWQEGFDYRLMRVGGRTGIVGAASRRELLIFQRVLRGQNRPEVEGATRSARGSGILSRAFDLSVFASRNIGCGDPDQELAAGCRSHEEPAPRQAGSTTSRLHDKQTYLPSSNTTSRLTDKVVSPGDTEVDSARSMDLAMAIIGTGRKPLPLPSEMLTMRRTRRPSDLA